MSQRFTLVPFLLSSALLAQVTEARPSKRMDVNCTLVLSGSLDRSLSSAVSGAAPLTINHKDTYEFRIPGRLEEWREVAGAVRFCFVPEGTFRGAKGRFHTTQTTIRPMVPPATVVIQGDVVAGMSPWNLQAIGRGADLIPCNSEVFMRGVVMESNDPALPVGRTNVPVTVPTVPLIRKDRTQVAMPHLRFTGVALWALANAKTPFTVQAEIPFDQTLQGDTVRGTLRVTFEMDPTK